MAAPDHAVPAAPGAAEKAAEPGTAEAGARSGSLVCQLLPTFSEACKLVGSAHSCLVMRTHRRALALSPRYLHKKRSGIQGQLSAELLKYSSKLEGVPVAFDNVKIVGEFGDIQDDVGYIHLTVQVDFVIFQPKCGEKLVGVVNKVAPSHIGCLVHGCFNASIPRPFKMPIEAWQHVGVKVGDRIEFEVFRLDSDAMGVFCIRAKMDREMEANAIERLNEAIKAQTSEVSSDTGKAAEDGADIEPKEIPEETPKKKAKKRALKETILQEVSGSTEGLGELNTTLEEIPKKKSKKKKHQEINSQTDFAEVNISVEDSATNSLYQSDDIISKKVRKKKSKHNDSLLSGGDADNNIRVEESSILGLDNESLVLSNQEQPKKSKKKKHKDNSDRDPNENLQNGITEESSFTEDLGAEDGTVLENLKKKRKKKRKRSFTNEDSILESTNEGADFTSQESLVDDLTIQHETPKQKKHKKNKTLH